jgi:hypothetical protein
MDADALIALTPELAGLIEEKWRKIFVEVDAVLRKRTTGPVEAAQVLATCLFLMQEHYEDAFTDAYVENLQKLAFQGVGMAFVVPAGQGH